MRRLALHKSAFAVLFAFVLPGSGALSGCAEPKALPPPETPKAPKPLEVVPEPPPDLSAVAEPKGLVVTGYVARVEETSKLLGRWSGFPIPGAREALAAAASEELADVVDLSKSVDFAVRVAGNARAPSVQVVVSVPVTSVDAAKAKLAKYTLTPMPRGATKVEGLLPASHDESEEPRFCILSPSPDEARARLVCGEQAALESLEPYVLRTLSRAPKTFDFHGDVRFAPLREPIEGVRRLLPSLASGLFNTQGTGPRTSEIIESAVGDVAELALDSDTASLDIDAKPEGAVAKLRYAFRSHDSTLAKLAVVAPSEVGPPPRAVLGLPADVDMAAWSKPGDKALFERPRRLVGGFFDEALGQDLKAGDRKALVDLFADRFFPLLDGGWVFGRGYDLDALGTAMSAAYGRHADEKTEAEQRKNLVVQAVGYSLVRVEKPAAEVTAVAKTFATVATKLLKEKKGKDLPVIRAAAVPPKLGLPQGSSHLEVVFPRPAHRNDAGKVISTPAPVVCHVLVVPDDRASSLNGTWVGAGCDDKLVAQRLLAARTPGTSTLGSRPESKELAASASRTGFFVTPRTFALAKLVDSEHAGLGTLSRDGLTQILVTTATEAPSADAKGGAFVTTVRIPKEAVGSTVGALLR
jgi:hypothetical protein